MLKTRLWNLWQSIRTSYWFVPTAMTVAAIALSAGTTALDASLPLDVTEKFGWLYSGGPEGARSILSTVAGSMITIAGVVFSITIVVLSLASSQFGPRLLDTFIRDTGTQVVIGTFVATFAYCLITLRVVRSGPGDDFVPHLSITVAFFLALAGTAVLIYFVHHIASAIQADTIIASVHRDLVASIERLFPEQQEHGSADPGPGEVLSAIPADFDREGWPLQAVGSGCVQAIDYEGLAELAAEHDLLLRLHFRPGDFVAPGDTLLTAWPREHWNEKLAERGNGAFIRGRKRTHEQDAAYAVNQLVEVALRALSPGINDPLTAMTCIQWLGDALGRIGQRRFPPGLRYDEQGALRLVFTAVSFDEFAEAAFGQIRLAAAPHPAVVRCMLESIRAISRHIRVEERRRVLERHADLVARSGLQAARLKEDRRSIEDAHRRTLKALGG